MPVILFALVWLLWLVTAAAVVLVMMPGRPTS